MFVDSIGHVHYRHRKPQDAWVVPYCLPLLHKYQCHINFEIASTSHLFQYLFKYIHKGPSALHCDCELLTLICYYPQVLIMPSSLSLDLQVPVGIHMLMKFENIGMASICQLQKLHGTFLASTLPKNILVFLPYLFTHLTLNCIIVNTATNNSHSHFLNTTSNIPSTPSMTSMTSSIPLTHSHMPNTSLSST